MKRKRNKDANTAYQSYIHNNSLVRSSFLLNSSSLHKDILKRESVSGSESELKFRSPKSFGMLFKYDTNKIRELMSGNARKHSTCRKNYKTIQSQENDRLSMQKRIAAANRTSNDVDYFQEYLKQTNFEIGNGQASISNLYLQAM